jgi:hypothetical protein
VQKLSAAPKTLQFFADNKTKISSDRVVLFFSVQNLSLVLVKGIKLSVFVKKKIQKSKSSLVEWQCNKDLQGSEAE